MFQDKNGYLIQEGDQVLLADEVYDIIVNIFTGELVADNDGGQVDVSTIHGQCEVIL